MKLMSTMMMLLCISLSSHAQIEISAESQVKDWERAKAYTMEYLDAMPESSYSLKPTPEMRSFAEQMLHLTDANYSFAAAAAETKSPIQGQLEKSADKSKASVTKYPPDQVHIVLDSSSL